ncbi:MAG: type I secretion system permease/ATPase [Dethiosulfovibrio peptidovorans]|nr:MAG: type I secretion system permease/ATPase [Dethiosulfovibrio peptidovorans]
MTFDGHGGDLASCLVYLARYHGQTVSRDALLSGIPLENGALNPLGALRAAERVGLAGRVVRAPLEKLNPLLFPAVLVLSDERACVLVSLDLQEGSVGVVTPEIDSVTCLSLDDLREEYAGYCLYFRPIFQFDERAPVTLAPREGHWFWSAISAGKGLYRDVLLASMISNLFALAMPLFTMNVYNRIIPNRAMESMTVLAIGVGVMLTADWGLRLARSVLVDGAAARTNVVLSRRLMEHILDLRSEERPPSVGSFANSVQGFEAVRSFISSATIFSFVDLPFALFFFAMVALIAWPLAVPMAVGCLLTVLHAVIVQGRMRDLAETTQRASAMKNATLVESLLSMEAVKAAGAESLIQGRWERAVDFLERAGVRTKRLSSSVVSGFQWVQQIVSVVTMVVGVSLVLRQSLSMGALIAAYMLTSRGMAPVGRLASLLIQYSSASRSLAALDGIMAKETERQGTFVSRVPFKGEITFDGVTFSYPGEESATLRDVSFRIEPGEKVALLGPLGSGKTTIARLVLGLYRPQEGAVLLDGVDIRQIDPAELRRSLGTVLQEPPLFFGSLRDNILFGHPPVGDEALLKAARIAGVEAFARQHPQGLNMPVGERGTRLSSGQRQCVALSRAVLGDPPVLLLDEPTASMDNRSEAQIRKNLAEYARDKTIILITHKMALLELVDRILVMDRGQIVADGPKETVLQNLRSGAVKRSG